MSLKFKREWERRGPIYVPRYDRVPVRNPHRRRTIPHPEALVSFIANAAAGAVATPNSVTTIGVNTTGANFAIAACVWDSGAADPTVTDSKGNTYTKLTVQTTTNHKSGLFYSANISAGSGHTWTCSGTNIFAAISAAAFNGVATSSPFDQQNGTSATTGTAINPGSVTPTQDNSLVGTGLGLGTIVTDPINVSIGSSYIIPTGGTVGFLAGNHYSVSFAYLIETTASATNPQWVWTNGSRNTSEIATFKPLTGSVNPDSWHPEMQRPIFELTKVVGY